MKVDDKIPTPKDLAGLIEEESNGKLEEIIGIVIDVFYNAYHKIIPDYYTKADFVTAAREYDEMLATIPKGRAAYFKFKKFLDTGRAKAAKIAEHKGNEQKEQDSSDAVFEQEKGMIDLKQQDIVGFYDAIVNFKDGNIYRGLPAALGFLAGWLGYASEQVAFYAGISSYIVSEIIIQFGCRKAKINAQKKAAQEKLKLQEEFNKHSATLTEKWRLKRKSEYEDAEHIIAGRNEKELDMTMANILYKKPRKEVDRSYMIPSLQPPCAIKAYKNRR